MEKKVIIKRIFRICQSQGFTLTELIIVLAIVSILAVIAIPAYVGVQKNTTRNEAYSNLNNLRLLEEQNFAETGQYAPTPAGVRNYNATAAADNGIEDILRGFRPTCFIDQPPCNVAAPTFGLSFTYQLTSVDTNGDGLVDGFTATATPVPGSRVAGDPVYWINQANGRNF